MSKQYTVFTDNTNYFEAILDKCAAAKKRIVLIYYNIDSGRFTDRLLAILKQKRNEGVMIAIMVDKWGFRFDNLRTTLQKKKVRSSFHDHQIDIIEFNSFPFDSTLHMKMCAVDDDTLFVGGSNLGDYYEHWKDLNFMLKGKFHDVGLQIFKYLQLCTSQRSSPTLTKTKSNIGDGITIGDKNIWLSVPHYHHHFSQSVLNLIQNAEDRLYLRSWNLLLSKRMVDKLRNKRQSGVEVNIMTSQRCKWPHINLIGGLQMRSLRKSGIKTYRHIGNYDHSKAYWNDKDEVLMGSANLTLFEMGNTVEINVKMMNSQLSKELTKIFEQNTRHCR